MTTPDGARLPIARWAAERLDAAGHVRRLFAEGQRLRALHGDDAVVDLALGQPLREPSEAVRDALRRAAGERGAARFGYMPNLGYPEVRERAAADVGRAGLDHRCVAITGGAGAAIVLALRTLVDPGDEVVGVSPYFGEYAAYCAGAGARFVPIPARPDLTLDVEAIEGALSERSAAVIVNTPCNPTGHVVTGGELRSLIEVLERDAERRGRRLPLIVDEVYWRLRYTGRPRPDPLDYPAALLARSFSKDLGLAGERIGYLAVHPALVEQTRVMRGLELCMRALGFVNAPATMQRMLLHLASWSADAGAHLARRDRAVADARGAGLEVEPPDGALYLWAASPWPDTLAFVEALAERHVLVAPGIAFGSDSFVRICFTAPPHRFERAMDVVREVVEAAAAPPVRAAEA